MRAPSKTQIITYVGRLAAGRYSVRPTAGTVLHTPHPHASTQYMVDSLEPAMMQCGLDHSPITVVQKLFNPE